MLGHWLENLFLAIRLAKGYFRQLASCRRLRVVKPPPQSPLPRSPLTHARWRGHVTAPWKTALVFVVLPLENPPITCKCQLPTRWVSLCPQVCVCVCVYNCIYIHTYTCVCVCVCIIYIYIYIYIYISTRGAHVINGYLQAKLPLCVCGEWVSEWEGERERETERERERESSCLYTTFPGLFAGFFRYTDLPHVCVYYIGVVVRIYF